MMAHAQLGDDNLLIYAGTTGGVLEVDADHLVLVSSKQLLNGVDVVIHHGRVWCTPPRYPSPSRGSLLYALQTPLESR